MNLKLNYLIIIDKFINVLKNIDNFSIFYVLCNIYDWRNIL